MGEPNDSGAEQSADESRTLGRSHLEEGLAEVEAHDRGRCLAALLKVSRRLVATLDLEAVLQAATDGVADLAGLDSAAVYLTDEDGLRLWATTPPLPPDFPEEFRRAPLAHHPHIGAAIESGVPVAIADLQAVVLTSAERSIVEARDLRTVLYIPLVVDASTKGALIVGSVGRPKAVSEAVVDLSMTLANLAALAVENARLFSASQVYVAELEQTLTERERLERERLELERRLLHSQRLESLGLLAGGIAHDFNNLLTAIIANLDLALLKSPAISPPREHIQQAVLAARRATDLTGQMLAYSGKGHVEVSAIDVNELVEENAYLLRSSAGKSVTFDVRLGGPLPAIEADAGQLQQLVMNLITNAAQAIGDRPGRITIATGVEVSGEHDLAQSLVDLPSAGRFVFLQISDTGCGMDEETRARMFDPFFSTKAAGRGLGMSALLGIVRAHRGAIFVDSAVGEGTTVRILLPAPEGVQTDANVVHEESSTPVDASRLSGTVLVVDDEEVVRNVCRDMAEFAGMDVLTAADGREAVELFRRHADEIGCVILDLTMPKMDGIAAFKELVLIKPDVKVVIASGFNEGTHSERLSALGVAGFIQKPYSLPVLLDAVRKATSH